MMAKKLAAHVKSKKSHTQESKTKKIKNTTAVQMDTVQAKSNSDPQTVSKKMKLHDSRIIRFIEGKDEEHLLFTGFVIILIGLVILIGVRIIQNDPTTFRFINRVQPHPGILSTSQYAMTDAVDATVSNVGTNDAVDPAFTLPDDQTLLTMDIAITNKTAITQNFFPVTQLYIRSREGGYFQMHPSTMLTNPIESGAISSGQTINGQVSFAIPKQLTQPLLYIDTGWGDIVPIVYDVFK